MSSALLARDQAGSKSTWRDLPTDDQIAVHIQNGAESINPAM